MNERIKLPRDVIRAIEHLSYDLNKTHEQILKSHKFGIDFNCPWQDEKLHYLNSLSYENLERALNKGYVVDDSKKSAFGIRNVELIANSNGIIRKKVKKTPDIIASGFQININENTVLMESKKALEAELDYELLSLNDGIKCNDKKEIERSKKRLSEIYSELGLTLNS